MSELVSIHCDVYFEDEKVGRIDIENGVLVKNLCYTKNIILHPCPRSTTVESVLSSLSERVLCPERCDEGMLKAIGVSEYNVYEILKKNHGVDFDDCIWLKYDDDPESLCWDDVMPQNRRDMKLGII